MFQSNEKVIVDGHNKQGEAVSLTVLFDRYLPQDEIKYDLEAFGKKVMADCYIIFNNEPVLMNSKDIYRIH